MRSGRTALLVAVPEAEKIVGTLRLDMDPVARLGVPAHVTILFPFIPAADVTHETVDQLRTIVVSTPAFEYALTSCQWFGNEVLWLAPDPADRFRELTRSIWRSFPDYPPYGGEFDDVIPHLTVADRADRRAMRSVEKDLEVRLPIRARADEVTLMGEDPSGLWRRLAAFGLRQM
jgi:2'-5' RNA ligase